MGKEEHFLGYGLVYLKMVRKSYPFKLSDLVVMFHYIDDPRNDDYASACDSFRAKPWSLVKECLKMVYPKDSTVALRRKLVRLMEEDLDMWIKMEDDSLSRYNQYPPPQMMEQYPLLPW